MPTLQSASSTTYPTSSPPTLSVTVSATGGNRLLICCIRQSAAGPDTISTVKYGGVDLTQVVQNRNTANVNLAAIYALTNPAVGTANLVVTFVTANGTFAIDAYVFTDADQTTPCEANGAVVGGVTPITETLTVTASATLIDVFAGNFITTGGTATATGGQTVLANVRETTGGSYSGSSYKGGLTAGGQSLTWTLSGASNLNSWDSVFVSVKHSTYVAPNRAGAAVRVSRIRFDNHVRYRRIQPKFTRLPIYGWIRRPYVPQFILRQRPVGTYGRGRVIGRFTHYAPPLPPKIGNKVLAPFTTREAVRDHFESRGWRTVQDQINAGYPYYAQPVPQNGSYTEIIDYGDVFTNTIVNVDWATSLITGTVNIDCQIRTSLDKITWTAPVSGTSLFVPSFRYLEVTINFTAVT